MGADGPLRRDTELRANRARGSSCPALAPMPLAVHVLGARAAVARGTGHQGEQGSQPGRPQNTGHGPSFDCSRWPHPCTYALASGRDHGASLVTSTPPTRCKKSGFWSQDYSSNCNQPIWRVSFHFVFLKTWCYLEYNYTQLFKSTTICLSLKPAITPKLTGTPRRML